MIEIGDAAAKWHADMPPSNMNMEHPEDSAVKESDELTHGEFLSFPAVSPFFRRPVQSGFSNPIDCEPRLRNSLIQAPSQSNQLRWKPMKSIPNLS